MYDKINIVFINMMKAYFKAPSCHLVLGVLKNHTKPLSFFWGSVWV